MNIDIIKNKIENDFVVLVDEEYGWKSWFWFPIMNEKELVTWWKNLAFVGKPLVGEVIEVNDESKELFREKWKNNNFFMMHIHVDDDSYLKTADGKMVFHKGYSGDIFT